LARLSSIPLFAKNKKASAPAIRATTLVALLLLTCCGKQKEQAARAPPAPVTVAQPTKRTVTDWDEFTGRFDAIEQVQVRARVTGFVTSVEFKDGAVVKAGDLLYVIDPRQYEAAAEQAQGQLADAKAKVELAQRELERASSLIRTQAIAENIVDQRKQALAAAEAHRARRRIHQGQGADHRPDQSPSGNGRQSGAGGRDAADFDRVDESDPCLFRHG
jgi:multidrug efflux pump subunit AcrA (membrane-fusion protein)